MNHNNKSNNTNNKGVLGGLGKFLRDRKISMAVAGALLGSVAMGANADAKSLKSSSNGLTIETLDEQSGNYSHIELTSDVQTWLNVRSSKSNDVLYRITKDNQSQVYVRENSASIERIINGNKHVFREVEIRLTEGAKIIGFIATDYFKEIKKDTPAAQTGNILVSSENILADTDFMSDSIADFSNLSPLDDMISEQQKSLDKTGNFSNIISSVKKSISETFQNVKNVKRFMPHFIAGNKSKDPSDKSQLTQSSTNKEGSPKNIMELVKAEIQTYSAVILESIETGEIADKEFCRNSVEGVLLYHNDQRINALITEFNKRYGDIAEGNETEIAYQISVIIKEDILKFSEVSQVIDSVTSYKETDSLPLHDLKDGFKKQFEPSLFSGNQRVLDNYIVSLNNGIKPSVSPENYKSVIKEAAFRDFGVGLVKRNVNIHLQNLIGSLGKGGSERYIFKGVNGVLSNYDDSKIYSFLVDGDTGTDLGTLQQAADKVSSVIKNDMDRFAEIGTEIYRNHILYLGFKTSGRNTDNRLLDYYEEVLSKGDLESLSGFIVSGNGNLSSISPATNISYFIEKKAVEYYVLPFIKADISRHAAVIKGSLKKSKVNNSLFVSTAIDSVVGYYGDERLLFEFMNNSDTDLSAKAKSLMDKSERDIQRMYFVVKAIDENSKKYLPVNIANKVGMDTFVSRFETIVAGGNVESLIAYIASMDGKNLSDFGNSLTQAEISDIISRNCADFYQDHFDRFLSSGIDQKVGELTEVLSGMNASESVVSQLGFNLQTKLSKIKDSLVQGMKNGNYEQVFASKKEEIHNKSKNSDGLLKPDIVVNVIFEIHKNFIAAAYREELKKKEETARITQMELASSREFQNEANRLTLIRSFHGNFSNIFDDLPKPFRDKAISDMEIFINDFFILGNVHEKIRGYANRFDLPVDGKLTSVVPKLIKAKSYEKMADMASEMIASLQTASLDGMVDKTTTYRPGELGKLREISSKMLSDVKSKYLSSYNPSEKQVLNSMVDKIAQYLKLAGKTENPAMFFRTVANSLSYENIDLGKSNYKTEVERDFEILVGAMIKYQAREYLSSLSSEEYIKYRKKRGVESIRAFMDTTDLPKKDDTKRVPDKLRFASDVVTVVKGLPKDKYDTILGLFSDKKNEIDAIKNLENVMSALMSVESSGGFIYCHNSSSTAMGPLQFLNGYQDYNNANPFNRYGIIEGFIESTIKAFKDGGPLSKFASLSFEEKKKLIIPRHLHGDGGLLGELGKYGGNISVLYRNDGYAQKVSQALTKRKTPDYITSLVAEHTDKAA